ncbi:peptidylprolyl isomerase [Streptomyces sp. NPDC003042]
MLLTALRVMAGTALAAGLVTGPAEPAPPAAPAAKPPECLYTPNAGQAAGEVGTPPARPAHSGTPRVTLVTDRGDIAFDADAVKAPCTVNSFAHLAGKDFFDKTRCHRLTTGALKVLQCGDPTASGSGGPGYRFSEENLPKAAPGRQTAEYGKGTVAMANAGPGTNGSQFFIVYGDTDLPPAYTVFGRISSGMNLLEEIAAGGSDNANGQGDGVPRKTVTIRDVTVTAAAR